MTTRPLILVTNDDGIGSPGLHSAVEAVAGLGDVLIVAPHTQQTSMGRAKPTGTLVGVIEERVLLINGTSYPAYAVNGSPTQAVLHALLEIAPRKPALCVSGINYGENLGSSLTRSGTVGAALEAASRGVPSIATSLEVNPGFTHALEYGVVNWETALHFTRLIAANVLGQGFPPEVDLLNACIPATANPQTALRLTRQSHQNYYEEVKPPTRNFVEPYRLSAQITFDRSTLEPDSDIYAFAIDRVVSVTPLNLCLTAGISLEEWNKTFMAQV